MSVTLVNTGTIATPPTRTSTNVKRWFALYNQLAGLGLGRRDLKAIGAYALTFWSNGNGGTDYRTNLPQLIADTAVYAGGLDYVDWIGQSVEDWNQGSRADGTLSTDVATLLKNAAILKALPEQTLDEIRVYLRNSPGA